MKILIIGCGRVGARLALRLENGGHEVAIVDENREALARLGGGFDGATFQGSGLDLEVLKRAGAEKCEILIALTGGDNRNLMIVQMAQHHFTLQRVLARLKDPVRAAIYRKMGIETLCTTTVTEGLLELWAINGHFPDLPGEMSASGDESALNE